MSNAMNDDAISAIERGATLSPCGLFRYNLWRHWGNPGNRLMFVMLNPSTADADVDDPTIRKCIGFARRNGFNGIDVVNLYAYRATKPSDLRAAGYPVGPFNDSHIISAAMANHEFGGKTICAWGAIGSKLERPSAVVKILRNVAMVDLYALSVCKDGNPGHPLMLPYSSELRPYT